MRIELSNVEFRYGAEPVLRGVNLRIEPGTLTVICGETGSGKSTLLQLLAGLESPTAGTVRFVCPENQGEAGSKKAARERIAVVFQLPEAQLFAGTVRQDMEYGLELRRVPKQERLPLVEDALRDVGLEPAAFLDRSPILLSGGEKRRVAVAGALVLRPEVLILDEPTAGLDPAAQRELLDILANLRVKGITVIAATHDLDAFFPVSDQVVVMERGRVAFAGEAAELAARPEILRQAGLELPSAVRIACRLREKGFDLPVPLCVEELIASLEKHLRSDKIQMPSGPMPGPCRQTAAGGNEDVERPSDLRNRSKSADKSLLYRLDPRMKWWGMVCLSLAGLSVTTGWGLAALFGLLAALFWHARIPRRKLRQMLSVILPMFGFLFVVSSVTFTNPDWSLGPVGISRQGALAGGLSVARFLAVILLGLLFAETTTGAPLREGFEWAIRPLRKAGVPTRDLSLAVSIALQFVPWILERIARLQKALRARGRDVVGIRKWTPRQISVLMVPLLIAILQMGDDLATAIESRGYNKQVERTPWHRLEWTRTDTISFGVTTVAAGILWWLG